MLECWTFGHWTSGHLDIRTFTRSRYIQTFVHLHMDIWTFGHSDIRAFGHSDIRTFVHPDIRTSGHGYLDMDNPSVKERGQFD